MAGKEIESDKEEEAAKITSANIDKLKVFIATAIEGLGAGPDEQAEALRIVLIEDWVELKTYIENFDMEIDAIVESIRQKYLELVEQSKSSTSPKIPAYTEGDKTRIREFLMSCMEYLEKESVDKITEACCIDDWERVKITGENYYGEDEMVDNIILVKEFLNQQFPDIVAYRKTKEE